MGRGLVRRRLDSESDLDVLRPTRRVDSLWEERVLPRWAQEREVASGVDVTEEEERTPRRLRWEEEEVGISSTEEGWEGISTSSLQQHQEQDKSWEEGGWFPPLLP